METKVSLQHLQEPATRPYPQSVPVDQSRSEAPVYMWSVNKVMRLIQYNSVFIFKLQIEFVPFKIVPLGGYTSPEMMFSLFVAALEVANRNRFYLVGYSFFDVFLHPKMASFKVKL